MKKTINFSIVGSDILELQDIKKQSVNDFTNEVSIESSDLDVQPGIAETIGILTIVISFASGLTSQILGSWIYDKLKPKVDNPKFEIYIEGVKVNSQTDIDTEVEKHLEKNNQQ